MLVAGSSLENCWEWTFRLPRGSPQVMGERSCCALTQCSPLLTRPCQIDTGSSRPGRRSDRGCIWTQETAHIWNDLVGCLQSGVRILQQLHCFCRYASAFRAGRCLYHAQCGGHPYHRKPTWTNKEHLPSAVWEFSTAWWMAWGDTPWTLLALCRIQMVLLDSVGAESAFHLASQSLTSRMLVS